MAIPNSVFGEEATFTVEVISVNTVSEAPTGTVTLKNGTEELGEATFDNGLWTLTVSDLPVGDHTITAEYSGDDNFREKNNTVQ